jgi:hypothetical protein
VYVEQSTGLALKAIVTEVKKEYMHPDFGLLQVGDLMLRTMPQTMLIGTWDKIVLLDRTFEQWDRLLKGTRDSLTNITQVSEITTVCAGAVTYAEGTDWNFTAPGTITWIGGGDAPANGAVYAARALYHPTFWYVGSARTGGRPAAVGNMPVMGRLVLKREEA